MGGTQSACGRTHTGMPSMPLSKAKQTPNKLLVPTYWGLLECTLGCRLTEDRQSLRCSPISEYGWDRWRNCSQALYAIGSSLIAY